MILKRSNTMIFFLKALLCAFLVKAIANPKVPTKIGTDARKPQCTVNNYFYAGPNTKKIEQQLAEIREEIKALKENRTTGGGSSGKGISLNILLFIVFYCSDPSDSVISFKRAYRLQKIDHLCFGSRLNSSPEVLRLKRPTR